ncbi:hypothetical protein HDU67_003958, partial [Dinochytrium kinnereticum]
MRSSGALALLFGAILSQIQIAHSVITSRTANNTLEFGYGCGGQCQNHYRWLLQEYQNRFLNRSFIELFHPDITTQTLLKTMFDLQIAPDVMSTLPAQVKQLSLLQNRMLANLSDTYEKYPYNTFPANYKSICTYTSKNETMQFCIPINIFAQKVFIRDQIFPVQYYFGALFTRLWGAELYERLLAGFLAWTSSEVTETMAHWKQMLDRQCFGNTTFMQSYDFSLTHRWWNRHPNNTMFGMTIMPSWYNYFRANGPEPLVNGDIPSMPFPPIRKNFPRVEIISAEAVAVSARSKNVTEAVRMAEFFTGADAHRQGLITGGVSSSFIPGIGSLNNSDYNMLTTADRVVLWFDGIAVSDIADYAYKAMRDFMLNQTTWPQHAKNLHNIAQEKYNSTTPQPNVFIDLTRSGVNMPRADGSGNPIFIENATVVFQPTTSNALIYYTIDGSEPIAGISTLYQKPVTLLAPRTFGPVTFIVKAKSLKPSLTSASDTASISVTVQRSSAVCRIGCQFGICIDDDICSCDAFHQNLLYRNCSEDIPQVFTSTKGAIGLAITVANSVLMAAYGAIGVLFIIYFNHKAIKAATSSAMVLIVVGCMMGCSALYFMIQKPTEFTCNARHWFFSI